ncbi:ZIP family metal transporter [Planctomicrobium sp. SH527]|uniref:ZIP family metal transporter n=1 Tax=Planctomicrobium sp. SH527 TaxID=3448123 RepID=UPI003F5BB816
MSSTYFVLAVYCILIVAASLLGGSLPRFVRLTHKRMQLLISFVGGLMLGIAVFHMLPHAIAVLGVNEINRVSAFVMLGLLVMFFLLRAFHFHHHDPHHAQHAGPDETPHSHDHDHGHSHDHNHDHDSHHGHSHDHDGGALASQKQAPQKQASPQQKTCQHGGAHTVPGTGGLDWTGVFLGLSVHTLIDGLALGASLQGDAIHQHSSWYLGLGTFLAILLHKPLDALSITALMQASHWPARWQFIVNAGFAMMCPLGAILFLVTSNWLLEQQPLLIGGMLAFSAGVFLCISLSDLLPEMEFHSHHRIPLSIALLLGIALAWGIHFLEPTSVHQPADQRAKANSIQAEPDWGISRQNPQPAISN